MNNELYCPVCCSDKLSADKKGFSGTQAAAGAIVTGPVGLLAGTIGSNKTKITCLTCGHEFKPGEGCTSKEDFEKKNRPSKYPMLAFIGIVLCFLGIIYYIIRATQF